MFTSVMCVRSESNGEGRRKTPQRLGSFIVVRNAAEGIKGDSSPQDTTRLLESWLSQRWICDGLAVGRGFHFL